MKNNLEKKSLIEKKEFVIEKSADLFFRNGYVNTGLNDILKACDIAKGSFYYYFSSKDEVSIITISNDLPFALGRFCAANGINNAITLSDHRDLEFANNYGMLLKELRLLARAVFVIDKKGQIAYKEVAKEIKTELNYDAALEVVMKAINE